MAGLPPDGEWVIQNYGSEVVLSHRHTGEELVRYDASVADESAKAQGKIARLDQLTEEQRAFAHFWSGYFYSHLVGR